MPRKKLSPQQAKALLIADGMDFQQDFHALGSSAVQALADVAKLAGYRKSKNAPGSTVRMFYQYLSRVEPVVRGAGELSPAERRAYQARAKKTQHATMKKSGAQLDSEIAEALARGPETDPGPHREKWRIEPSQIRVGQRFDYFGQEYEITKIGRDKERTIQVARRVRDPFGKELWIDQRSFPMRAIYRQHLSPIGDNHARVKQAPSTRRFSVKLIHNGSDWAVVNATAKDIAADDGFAMTHADAVKLAKESAQRDKCRWFDMS
jgi:hypothetical protein